MDTGLSLLLEIRSNADGNLIGLSLLNDGLYLSNLSLPFTTKRVSKVNNYSHVLTSLQ